MSPSAALARPEVPAGLAMYARAVLLRAWTTFSLLGLGTTLVYAGRYDTSLADDDAWLMGLIASLSAIAPVIAYWSLRPHGRLMAAFAYVAALLAILAAMLYVPAMLITADEGDRLTAIDLWRWAAWWVAGAGAIGFNLQLFRWTRVRSLVATACGLVFLIGWAITPR